MQNKDIPEIKASEWSGLSTVAQADLVRKNGGKIAVTWHGDIKLYVATPKNGDETDA